MSRHSNNFPEHQETEPNFSVLETRVKKLEVKSWFEIFLTPVTLVVLSFLGSWYLQKIQAINTAKLTKSEIDSAREIADASRASAEKMAEANLQTQSLDIFFKYIADSQNPTQQKLAIETLRALDPSLADGLAAQVRNIKGVQPSVADAAEVVQQDAKEQLEFADLQSNLTARMTRNSMRLRPVILSTEQKQKIRQGDNDVAETLCLLPLDHRVDILEDGDGWTQVKTNCPSETEFVTGYVSDWAGSPPIEPIQ